MAMTYAWNTYSDVRVKCHINPLDYGLDEILMLEARSYLHHSQLSEDHAFDIDYSLGKQTIGLVAQEVYEIIPEAVHKPEKPEDELWSVDYAKLVPVLIKGMQELSDKCDQLQKENEEQKKLYTQLAGGDAAE